MLLFLCGKTGLTSFASVDYALAGVVGGFYENDRNEILQILKVILTTNSDFCRV
jgi:hypothetical protein